MTVLKCSSTQPCTAAQLLEMSRAGGLLTGAMRSVVSDAQLPQFVSAVGLSTIQAVSGSVEGILGKGLNELQSLSGVSSEQLGLVVGVGSQIIKMLFTGIGGSVDPLDAMQELISLTTKITTDVATALVKDAVSVVPIAGAILSVVVTLVQAIIEYFGGMPPHTLADAQENEARRREACNYVTANAKPIASGVGGVLPCDLFNGAPLGPWNMPPAGAVLIVGSENNTGIPAAMRSTLRALRLLIQGSSLAQQRGKDPFTGLVVPRTPGLSTDGGQSLWPIYMDILLRYRQLGALSNDQLFNRINGSAAACGPEYTQYGIAVIEQWREQKRQIDTGTGYGLWNPQDPKLKLTPSKLSAMRLGAAFYAGKEAGIKYSVKQAGSTLALVGPGGIARSFSSQFASRTAPAKSSYTVPVIMAAGLGLYLWRRKK